jgi:hypothetical protein
MQWCRTARMEHGDYLVVGSYRASRLRIPELVLYVLDWTELMWRFPTHPSVYWTGVWSGVWSPYTIGNRVCCMSIIINIRVARAQIHNTMPIRHALDDTRFCPACWFGWETLTHAHTHTHTLSLSFSRGRSRYHRSFLRVSNTIVMLCFYGRPGRKGGVYHVQHASDVRDQTHVLGRSWAARSSEQCCYSQSNLEKVRQ